MHNAGKLLGVKNVLAKRATRNQLRIIGGKWRGRKIHFPTAESLRPTPDRVRETLFNWLAGWVEGATCVDLFAGSGALGFEAGSRGAAKVILVDKDTQVGTALKTAKQELAADNIEILASTAEAAISRLSATDILFLDPPFNYPDLNALLQVIGESKILNPGAWIYVESAADRAIVAPPNWHMHRHKQAGQVAYRLFQNSEPQ